MTEANPVPETCPPAWGHAAGFLALNEVRAVPTTLEELADRDLARESALRYSYAYDERRLDVLRSLLTADAKFSISTQRNGGPISGRPGHRCQVVVGHHGEPG